MRHASRPACALGEHHDPAFALALPASHCCVLTRANHWDLLDRAEVSVALRDWLA